MEEGAGRLYGRTRFQAIAGGCYRDVPQSDVDAVGWLAWTANAMSRTRMSTPLWSTRTAGVVGVQFKRNGRGKRDLPRTVSSIAGG
jgi:hypothetical protein